MAREIPWLLVCVVVVPVIMVVTKTKRIDAREMHEIQMRIKYYSEFWQKGAMFTQLLQQQVLAQLRETAEPLHGRAVDTIAEREWVAAAMQANSEPGSACRYRRMFR